MDLKNKFWIERGSLYRYPDHHIPLRDRYAYPFGTIKTFIEFKSTLRHGSRIAESNLPLFFVSYDLHSLCFDCARKHYRKIILAIKKNARKSGFFINACQVNFDQEDLTCDHCESQIPCAPKKPVETRVKTRKEVTV